MKSLFKKKAIKEAVQFANFAQRVKMVYWINHGKGSKESWYIHEKDLDTILLLAWADFKKESDKN